jgi:hypothetical protein
VKRMSTIDRHEAEKLMGVLGTNATIVCKHCGRRSAPYAAVRKGTDRGFCCNQRCAEAWTGEREFPAEFGSNPEAL